VPDELAAQTQSGRAGPDDDHVRFDCRLHVFNPGESRPSYRPASA
jgi:hypothetical protein